MSHLVTLRTDPANPGIVYLCTDPSMAPVMGGFGPARYVGNNPPVKDASYLIATDELPRFRVYCVNRSVRVVDTEEEAPRGRGPRPAWAERPLPECRECGQPVARGVSPSFCPNCGAVWDAVEVVPGQAREEVVRRVCSACGVGTPAAFSHCVSCGHAEL